MVKNQPIPVQERVLEFRTTSIAAELGIACYGAFFNYSLATLASRGYATFDLSTYSTAETLGLMTILGALAYVLLIPHLTTKLVVLENFRTLSLLIAGGATRRQVQDWVFRSYFRHIVRVGWRLFATEFLLLTLIYFGLVELGVSVSVSALAFMSGVAASLLLYVPLTAFAVALRTIPTYRRFQATTDLPESHPY